jgi:hypothetical protein
LSINSLTVTLDYQAIFEGPGWGAGLQGDGGLAGDGVGDAVVFGFDGYAIVEVEAVLVGRLVFGDDLEKEGAG